MLHARPYWRVLAQHSRPLHDAPPPRNFAAAAAATCQRRRCLLTLAIETSCDDTAVAILETDSRSHSDATTTTTTTSTPTTKRARARLLFNEKVTAPNTGLGGIHPIEALESHQANLSKLVAAAVGFLPDATTTVGRGPGGLIDYGDGTVRRLPDFISVTRGPGMRSNLHCGLDTAKGLAAAWRIPLLGVNHMQAHALTPRLVAALQAGTGRLDDGDGDGDGEGEVNHHHERCPDAVFPFLTLLISGGHTMLLHSRTLTDHKILATTVDVAIGDALDKAGRMILPQDIKQSAGDTAFAKHLSNFAFPHPQAFDLWTVPKRRKDEIDKPDNHFGWQIQAPFADTKQLSFSFTSIPSTVDKILQRRSNLLGADVSLDERRLLGRTALGIAFEHLASRTVIALESLRSAKQDISTLVVSGGVAANPFLRFFLRAVLDVRGFNNVKLLFPPPWLCTDNAAMIAWCGVEMFEAGFRSELDIQALRKWSMDSAAQDGGILGAKGWTTL